MPSLMKKTENLYTVLPRFLLCGVSVLRYSLEDESFIGTVRGWAWHLCKHFYKATSVVCGAQTNTFLQHFFTCINSWVLKVSISAPSESPVFQYSTKERVVSQQKPGYPWPWGLVHHPKETSQNDSHRFWATLQCLHEQEMEDFTKKGNGTHMWSSTRLKSPIQMAPEQNVLKLKEGALRGGDPPWWRAKARNQCTQVSGQDFLKRFQILCESSSLWVRLRRNTTLFLPMCRHHRSLLNFRPVFLLLLSHHLKHHSYQASSRELLQQTLCLFVTAVKLDLTQGQISPILPQTICKFWVTS